MSGTVIALIVLAVIALILFMSVIGIYNKLVTLKNRFQNAFSQIEVQLQRRYDLIPNLIETVKGYMKHEKETLEAVIQARNQAMGSLKTASMNPGDAWCPISRSELPIRNSPGSIRTKSLRTNNVFSSLLNSRMGF